MEINKGFQLTTSNMSTTSTINIEKGQVYKSVQQNFGNCTRKFTILNVVDGMVTYEFILDHPQRKTKITIETSTIEEFVSFISSFVKHEQVKLVRRCEVIVDGGEVLIGVDIAKKQNVFGFRDGFTNIIDAISILDVARQSNQIKHQQGRKMTILIDGVEITNDSQFSN